MVVGDIAPTQVEELLMGTCVEDIPSTSDHASVVVVGLDQEVLSQTNTSYSILEELSLK